MKSRRERLAIVQQLQEKYDAVLRRVRDIPGVQGVEIGFKEVGGEHTDEIVFRIVVQEKRALADLRPEHIIPPSIEGIKTDVVVATDSVLIPGTDQLPDENKYRPLRGGIQIHNNTSAIGTLGCIATWNDGSGNTRRVALSNHHVLYANGALDGQKIGQPKFYRSCCCDCDKIGVNVKGDTIYDCAIAQIESGTEVRNTIEEIGDIKGTATPTVGDKVIKRGRTTGLTTGEIKAVNMASGFVRIEPIEGRRLSYVDSSNNPVLISNPNKVRVVYGIDTEKFAYSGDSGSVILLNDAADPDHHKVVALLYAVDGATNTEGYAYDINKVMTALNITIHSTPDIPPNSIAAAVLPRTLPREQDALATFEAQLRELPTGQRLLQLFYKHREEVALLLNDNRRAAVVWRQNRGPQYIAAIRRSVQYPDYQIPEMIEGVAFAHALEAMTQLLQQHGSPALLHDLAVNKAWLWPLMQYYTNAADFLQKVKESELQELFI
jgi:hypothetical protein